MRSANQKAQNHCSSLLGATKALKITAQACSEPQKRFKTAAQATVASSNTLKSLLKPARSNKSASKPLLKPASRLQWRSKSLLEYHCSKSLFEDASLCDTLLCSPVLLLYMPLCMDMHGFTLVSDISDDHIRGQYEGGIWQPQVALGGPHPLRPLALRGGRD